MAHDVKNLIGDSKSTGPIIDESSFAKQGKISVGTSRQWLGRLGKTDNGQVAVFGALANNRFVSPVDVRLYLPKEWIRDESRCDKAGIPKNERKFHTKIELALKIVEQARKNRLNYGWIGADAGYGKGPGFCMALAKMSEIFVVDVHSDFLYIRKTQAPIFLRKEQRPVVKPKSIELIMSQRVLVRS